MGQHEAMTDGRLSLTGGLSLTNAEGAELLDEIDRMRTCKVCDGARVLFNDGQSMRPAHGWTGSLVEQTPGKPTPIHVGQAMACLTCEAMDALRNTTITGRFEVA